MICNKMSVHIAALLHYEIPVQVLSAYLCEKFQIIPIFSTFFCHEISVYILPISLNQLFYIVPCSKCKFIYIHILPHWNIGFQ